MSTSDTTNWDVTGHTRSIFLEYARVHPSIRPYHHWVIDHRTWRDVRDLQSPNSGPLVYPVIDPNSDWTIAGQRVEWSLVGLPVVLDDGGENLRLVCNGGVRSKWNPHVCPSCGGTHG